MSKTKKPEAGWYVRHDHTTEIMDGIGNHVAETFGRDGDEAEARAKLIVETVNRFSFLDKLEVYASPTHTKRRIVWDKDGKSGIAMLIISYTGHKLYNYVGMAQEVMMDFPDADINSAGCHRITESRHEKGATLLTLRVPGPKRDVPGYIEWDSIDFNY